MGKKIKKHIRIVDDTLRDGSNTIRHQFTPEQMARVAEGLDKANIEVIQVGHGEGLAGSAIQYGFSAATDQEYLEAVSSVIKRAKLSIIIVPGLATKKDIELSSKYGAKVARICTHGTEADLSEQHIGLAKEKGMEAIGMLMMVHLVSPEKLLEQAKLMEGYGADVIYLSDSAGALTPFDVKKRFTVLREGLKPETQLGLHPHHSMGQSICNSLMAIECGATMIDGTCCGMGGGAGNAPTEVLAVILEKMGYDTGISLYAIQDVAEDIVRPIMPGPVTITRTSLMSGYAGVPARFLHQCNEQAERFGVEARDVMMELGRRKIVGGQEDMIIKVAHELAEKKKLG